MANPESRMRARTLSRLNALLYSIISTIFITKIFYFFFQTNVFYLQILFFGDNGVKFHDKNKQYEVKYDKFISNNYVTGKYLWSIPPMCPAHENPKFVTVLFSIMTVDKKI